MPDFGTFTPKCTLVRTFGHITDIAAFRTAITDFKAATTLVSSTEISAEEYSETKHILSLQGAHLLDLAVAGSRKGENPDEDVYAGFTALLAAVNNDLAEAMYEEGSTAVADSDTLKLKNSYKVKFSNGDTGTVTFGDKKIILSGYTLDATGTSFSTWADTKAIFSTDPDA